MKSPSGIEITVGQVWQWHREPRITIFAVHGAYVSAGDKDGYYLSLPISDFTNERGGYRLVKEAPDDLQK